MGTRYYGSVVVRLVAIAVAVPSMLLDEVQGIVSAIFLWLVADSVERMSWREKKEKEYRPEQEAGNPWDHFSV